MTYDEHKIIDMYKNGMSINAIAREVGTYPNTIHRMLRKHYVALRHDRSQKGRLLVKDGEKLIEWAKAQGRPVTKKELAEVIGRKKLSPSYFVKYPELGQYVETYGQQDLNIYTDKLYSWLKENDIPFKPNDRTKLKVSVHALLLGKYTGIALHVGERATCVSRKAQYNSLLEKTKRANEVGIQLILLDNFTFRHLDGLKETLDKLIGEKE